VPANQRTLPTGLHMGRPQLTMANHESRLSSPYLTLHWSRTLNDFALGQLARTCRSSGNYIAVLLDQLGDVVAAAAAARLALDREGRDEEVGEGVGVVSHRAVIGKARSSPRGRPLIA
jgi:hypothetical protein